MNKNDLIKEQFKQALNSTIKAISGETYPLKDKKNLKEFNISKFDNLKDKENFIKLRAEADSEALKRKFSDNSTLEQNIPKTPTCHTLYKISEKIRYELLGSQMMKGISKVRISGYPSEEIEISVRENDIKKFELSFQDINNAINSENIDITGYEPVLGGQLAEKAVWVDEAKCIGCQYCVHVASNTFTVDEFHGRSRAIRLDGDSSDVIQEAIDTCPVDCIHWVKFEELDYLENSLDRDMFQTFGKPPRMNKH